MLHFISYILFYPVISLISILPFRILYWVSDFIFYIFFYLIRYRKKLVLHNLEIAFPDKSPEERLRIREVFYRHFVDLFMEMIKTSKISGEALLRRMKAVNEQDFLTFFRENPNTILMTSHHANYEWLVGLNQLLPYPAFAIYKKVKNKYFNNYLIKTRGKFNCVLVPTKEIIGLIEKNHNEAIPGLYGFASDQSPKRNKIYHHSPFFGHRVPVHTSTEMLAKKYNYPIVILNTKKLSRGFYETRFEVLAEEPRLFPDYQITDLFMQKLEKQIREQPEYYFWTHNRFKYVNRGENNC